MSMTPHYSISILTRPSAERLDMSQWPEDVYLKNHLQDPLQVPSGILICDITNPDHVSVVQKGIGLFPGCSQGRASKLVRDADPIFDYTSRELPKIKSLKGNDLVKAFVESEILAQYYTDKGLPPALKNNRAKITAQLKKAFKQDFVEMLQTNVSKAYGLVFKN